ncbi:methyltransferase isoform A [Micractinium conductrix]|uniref:Methyltransferase isoform A n=1 Tax=Micractinium conductrix TaxID=554055 RepID=A0A2P6V8Z2_9CHLO|nr:methyltransferase isoform B [Micractinium conductrix]PSC70554.1 methyltransferase isoform A [Micractinium conductrix]|eukprot:PSC70553.1 methyltransferase isoform B [Micractinium conductrix]
MTRRSSAEVGSPTTWLVAGGIAFCLALFLLPRASTADAHSLSAAPSTCPVDCNAQSGWGKCEGTRCVCKLGRGGPACAFSFSSIYGKIPVFDLKEGHGLQACWSPPAETYHKYLKEADAVTAIEIGAWKGKSSSFIASWLQEQGRGVLVSVDTWLGSPEFWQQDAMANPEFSLRLVHGWPTIY